MPSLSLSSPYHYIRFSVSPPCSDALLIRKSIQDSLAQSFGLVSSNTYVDVLWVAEDGTDVVVRISRREAVNLMASAAAYLGSPRLSVVKESPFLPSLLCVRAIS